jgi:hypothetical protein
VRWALLALVLGACGSDPAPERSGTWTQELADVPGALLSVAGVPGDLWAVGGGLGNGTGAVVLHDAGQGWERADPGVDASLWWVWRSGPGEVFAVGDRGTVLRRRDGAWEPQVIDAGWTPGEEPTLYGVWGSSAQDVWAVGGSPVRRGPDDVVLHFDGVHWTTVAVPEPKNVTLFKVWGDGAGHVWMVGEQGLVLLAHDGVLTWHGAVDRDGSALPVRLVTVAGSAPDDVWAVGGPDPASGPQRTMLLRLDPERQTFVLEKAPGSGVVLNGISASGKGALFAVGFGGAKLRRESDGTWHDDSLSAPRADLHGVLALPGGEALAVGGDFAAIPRIGDLVRGWLYRYRP